MDPDPNPDPPDQHVFGPPGSVSISQRYESGSGSFYYHAKIVRKTFFFVFLFFFLFFLFVHYSALLHLPPLRFHCADGCWDRTQDRCNWCIGSQTL